MLRMKMKMGLGNPKLWLLITVIAAVLTSMIIWSAYVFPTIYSTTPPRSSSSSSSSSACSLPACLSNQTHKELPPLETFGLTKELLQQAAKDNIVIVTFGNYAFTDFILNWVKHLTDLGLSNFLVGAMDTQLLGFLYSKGVPVFTMTNNLGMADVAWGSSRFHKIGRSKVVLVESILNFGFELLLSDTDVVWLKNPLPYFSRYPDADLLVSTDQLALTVSDDRLEIWDQVTLDYNIGIFHWRPTETSKKLAWQWKEMLSRNETVWDQNMFNGLVSANLGPSVEDESGLVYAFDGRLKLGILPASIFCSGHTYFVQAMPKQLRLQPYAVHTTFQYSGSEGKRHRLREAMIFYNPLDYYDPSGGLISFKSSIPRRLLLDGKHSVESHFALVNYQIKQIREALAVATLLNRTLVMPPLWCRLDRLWYPHPGIIPGSMTRQPFLCPLDHVFRVDVMLQEQPEEKFGPLINFREYSFFENPSLPEHVKRSWLDVQLCQEGSPHCDVSSNSGSTRVLRFPRNSSEDVFRSVFSSFKDVKVIQFSSMTDVFRGFSDRVREKRFRNRVKSYMDSWCCEKNRGRVYIDYDIYWDEKSGWKPHLN